MRRRGLLASGLAFLLLLGAALVLLRSPETTEGDAWFALARRSPDTLTVIVPPDTTVLVPGGPTGWRILAPVEDEADPLAVAAMLRRLEALEPTRTFPFAEEKRDTYGFRFPRALLRAAYVDGLPPDTLLVGAFSIDGNQDYVRAGERGDVGLVPGRETRPYLVRRLFDLRMRELLPFHESRAVRLTTFDSDGSVIADLTGGPDAWRLAAPFPGRANPAKVREYLLSLNHMDARSVERDGPGPLAPYGLVVPTARFRVLTVDGDTLGVDLGDPVPGTGDRRYALVEGRPHVWGVPEKYLEVARSDLAFLRDLSLGGFGQVDVDSLRVEGTGTRTYPAAAWSGAGADSTLLRDVIRGWISLDATEVLPDEPGTRRRLGLAPPRGRLVWYGKADTLAVVEVGEPRNGRIALALPGGREARPGELFLVEESLAEPLWRHLDGRGAP